MINLNTLEQSIQLIKHELKNMPKVPGVYRMLDQDQKVLYVGKAKDLSKRISDYTQINRLTKRIKTAISLTKKIEIITVNSEAQALILEAELIKSLKPKYNILLKDDKSLPYLLVKSTHQYPQIVKHRGARCDQGEYFGPFASSFTVDQTIEFIEKTFKLRSCTDNFFNSRKTACLQYQIKRCSAPCVSLIKKEEYAENVKQVLSFLKGKTIELQNNLSEQMQNASHLLEFEKAAKFRDQLRALNYIQNKNSNLFSIADADIIGISKESDKACVQVFLFRNYQNYGNKSFFYEQVEDENIANILSIFILQFYKNNILPKNIVTLIEPENFSDLKKAIKCNFTIAKTGEFLKAANLASNNASSSLARKFSEKNHRILMFEQIQEIFNLDDKIERIDVIDNSHIMGANAIGAVISCTNEGFIKRNYRKYNIETTSKGDDYQMLREVLTRKLKKIDDTITTPDLILIDGGKGHLSAASDIFKQFNSKVPFVCISKGVDRNAGEEFFHQIGKESFTMDKNSALMKFLQILRDEAHRFAITTHRKKREKAMNFSILDKIPNIGPKRKNILINHFTNIKEISSATIEQLTKLKDINQKIAEQIFKFFNS